MAISLLSNPEALNVKRNLEVSGMALDKSLQRLSSGKRINNAGDDAAGLAISNTMDARIRSVQQARRNAMDALSMMQVAEGGMNETSNLLVRLRELATQAASDTVGDKERLLLDKEAQEIKSEIDRLANSTKYLDTNLLNGTKASFTFQIGPENGENDRVEYTADQIDVQAGALGVDGISISDQDSARDALDSVDGALHKLNIPRASIGAMQSRMQSITNGLSVYEENLTSANSRIKDADFAQETTKMVQSQILQQTGAAVLSQANQKATLALRLLGQ
jgi:flagellin